MNIVYLIGNGFDLNLGLKTRYSDFYDYYKTIPSEEEVIIALKKSIDKDINTWADLELQLGKYTEKLNTQDEFDIVYFDLVEQLKRYLLTEQEKVEASNFDIEIFFDDLTNPRRVLSQREQQNLLAYLKKWNDPINIRILTFNYTKTIEIILGDFSPNQSIGVLEEKRNFHLRDIEHIHRHLDQSLVLGVNDLHQIKNEKLRESQEVIEAIVKPVNNHEQGHMIDEHCMEIISKAHLIFIFGSSIGQTDKIWWEAIAKNLGQNCRLVIFSRGSKADRHNSYYLREKRMIKENFLSMAELTQEEKDIAKDYIYVGITRDLFNLKRT